jgi:thiol:disulfide interchange protein DsbD
MKRIIKLFLLVAPLFAMSFTVNGQPAIKWSFKANKLSNNTYNVSVSGILPANWHMYGINNTIQGLTPPVLNFEYENVAVIDKSAFASASEEIKDPVFENKKTQVYERSFSFTQQIKINGIVPASLKGTATIYTGKASEFYPIEQKFDIQLEGGVQAQQANSVIRLASIDLANPLSGCGNTQQKQSSSLWAIFLLGFAGGLVALLTPCVFPMIPFTVSYFTRSSANRKASIRNGMLYGFFIFMIYILLSVPFHVAGNVNPEIFNTISTNVYLNVFFFGTFIFFALSFFGVFEITLPSSLANKADEKSSLNLGGIFFMSLTLALVSFSCTGPILGSLLVGSIGGGVWQLTAGLAGFGVALGLPFGLFAVFPNMLKALPKSGGWLDTVKKVLAFVELALAFKFLSNADLVMHWGIIKREVFIGIWLLVSLGLTAYLFGLYRLPHDTKGLKIPIGRKVLAGVTLIFSIYLITGIIPGKTSNLDLLSGFPPPLSYSLYGNGSKGNDILEANVINDFDKAIRLSDSLHKPLLIDFTGWACVNCRKMEENVWNKPEVNGFIKKNYILVSLYVDDRKKLPVQERITYTTKDKNQKEIVTFGDKWSTFESENFGQVSQPFYAIIDNKQRLINNPIGYTPNVSEYLSWLQCGTNTFKGTLANNYHGQ